MQALGLRREKHNFWGKDLGISLAICLRLSASHLGLPKSLHFFNGFSCQCSWVASLENGAGWLNVSQAQKLFEFINRMNELLVLSSSHLAAKLSKRFGFRSSQCGNLAILCQASKCEIVIPNKKFKPDYQRAAESVPKWFSDYGALLKVTLCVGSSLIWR
ncbi:hypothetical protein EAY27_19385 [Vibrio anguillarum]|uniref:hypothetical protein n=1 Tax=Vibrio anguillarum TaxID=55601 RepID=UPI00188C4985|nr:hypothetical protein [Vibrio anguillarum]MBF4258376.1 hypothetical protein [Vibrio anguillarum]MBF4279285.1 hypothetical protein [Vibrio anguillarum]MBF4301156.1 hypothetical protein [Vibrio anguillarum]MBF4364514.1 hypothetical protein [Vibrio anguillarum]MBF4400055.1 hypothetical protein [Vibrio anguillarum]